MTLCLCACVPETPTSTQPPPPAPAPQPTKPLPALCGPYLVTAQVVNGYTGSPIGGARVYKTTVRSNGFSYWCTTGRDGTCGGDLGIVGEGVWFYFLANYGGVDSSDVAIPAHPPRCEEWVTLTVYPE